MQYYVEDRRAQRIGGLVALLIYLLFLGGAVAVVEFNFEAPPAPAYIEIEFIEQEFIPEKFKTPPPTPTRNITQQRQIQNQGTERVNAPEPQKVDQRAIFKAPSAAGGTQHTGEAPTSQSGNRGNESGQANRADYGAGKGVEGASWNLSGRSLRKNERESLPKPNYSQNATGVVVVEITVDAAGNVISATYRVQGSTTSNSELVTAAISAARRAKFSPSDNVRQAGTIAYNFVLE